jgi:hypothetical protein
MQYRKKKKTVDGPFSINECRRMVTCFVKVSAHPSLYLKAFVYSDLLVLMNLGISE